VTISGKLLHQVNNRITAVQGFIELGMIEEEERKRMRWLEKARDEIRKLQALLEQHRERKP
jgi:predicted transcriptional regulator with HTH domain